MAYRRYEGAVDPARVRVLTFVPFLPDGRCSVLADGDGARLPAGQRRADEEVLPGAALRLPVETAGFRPQRVHVFGVDEIGDDLRLYLWLDGDRHRTGPVDPEARPLTGTPDEIRALLERSGRPEDAVIVADAVESFATQSDASYYADNVAVLEPAYLAATTPEGGSGFSGDAGSWRARREMIVDGLDRDGTFLDLGCANGLLMASVHAWAAERGREVEPYGVDISFGLVRLARRRLPRWADRIEVGNAVDYLPRRRFDFVHVLEDLVPAVRRGDMVQHALDDLVEPDGRVLVSRYGAAVPADPDDAPDGGLAGALAALGFVVAGSSRAPGGHAETVWIDRPSRKTG